MRRLSHRSSSRGSKASSRDHHNHGVRRATSVRQCPLSREGHPDHAGNTRLSVGVPMSYLSSHGFGRALRIAVFTLGATFGLVCLTAVRNAHAADTTTTG